MMIAFEPNTKLSPEATRLRFEVWKEANGDLGNALWTEATQRAIRALKWMPKPSELREQGRPVAGGGAGGGGGGGGGGPAPPRPPPTPAPPQETPEERLANTVAIYRKHDRPADAERVQRMLDDLLKRKAI